MRRNFLLNLSTSNLDAPVDLAEYCMSFNTNTIPIDALAAPLPIAVWDCSTGLLQGANASCAQLLGAASEKHLLRRCIKWHEMCLGNATLEECFNKVASGEEQYRSIRVQAYNASQHITNKVEISLVSAAGCVVTVFAVITKED